jgi:hypothetical protein
MKNLAKLCLGILVTCAAVNAAAGTISTDSARIANTERYQAIPVLHKIEFIHDSTVEEGLLSQYLTPATIALVKSSKLQWLQVREVAIDKENVVEYKNGVMIPVELSVRYMQTKNWTDGTVNVQINVDTTSGTPVVSYVGYDDNAGVQMLGRNLGSLDVEGLAKAVTVDTMQSFLAQPGQLDQIVIMKQN